MFLRSGREIEGVFNSIRNSDNSGEVRLAVAYWGSGVNLELGKNYRIICDLDSGGCHPEVIEKYVDSAPDKIKRLRKLHAKVILSDFKAIISSANISVNGLGLEGKEDFFNHEAGYLTERKEDIEKISSWFEELWRKSSFISKEDLGDAWEKWNAKKQEAQKINSEILDLFELLKKNINSRCRLRACTSKILGICKDILSEENVKEQELGKISSWALHLIINCTGRIMDYGKGAGVGGSAGDATNEWINERINKHNPEVTKPRIEKIISGLKNHQEITCPATRKAASQALINLPWRNSKSAEITITSNLRRRRSRAAQV